MKTLESDFSYIRLEQHGAPIRHSTSNCPRIASLQNSFLIFFSFVLFHLNVGLNHFFKGKAPVPLCTHYSS